MNKVDKSGNSPLYLSCNYKKPKVTKYLFQKGAKLIVDKIVLINRLTYAGIEGDLEFIKLLNLC